MTQQTTDSGPKLTFVGWFFILLIVGGCVYAAYMLFSRGSSKTNANAGSTGTPTQTSTGGSSAAPTPTGTSIDIGIAYGTEKKRWLEWATQEFAKTPAGKRIGVNLIPMGSLEAAQAILKGSEDGKKINVWSPASAVYTDIFVSEWQTRNGDNPIAKQEPIALSPMVFVMWDERYQAFVKKYSEVSFNTIAEALQEKGGWDAIAGKPEWGVFKFSHTNPNESNSGLVTLVLMAYQSAGKTRGMEMKDILDAKFQKRMTDIESGVNGMSNSTGNMMRDMVLKGPSSFDCLMVYESVAIDYLKNAEGRWGKLRVVYPPQNMWNDNPYYVLNVPWSDAAHRKAAGEFMDFLLTEQVQSQSLVHGFRPANPAVAVKFPESPFVVYQSYGLQVDLTTMCEPPRAEVVNNLLASWQRSFGTR